MSMERWNPFREFESMRQAMDRWFDERGRGNLGFSGGNQPLSLAVDLHETGEGYELTASLPGVKPDNVEINVDRDMVTIRGRTEETGERQEGNFLYRERHMGSYSRTLRLPEQVNAEQVEATLEHGVLRVKLPRLQQTIQRRIKVRSGSDSGSQPLNTGSSQTQATDTTTGAEATQSQVVVTERPALLDTLSGTQMDELERQVNENDRNGFNWRAESFGWDAPTSEQIWRYMAHRVTKDEVKKAFGGES